MENNLKIANTHIPAFLIWLLPSLILIFGAFFSYANVDSVRDFIEAHRIASGEGYTLVGPQMAFSFRIGPWWFYVLSTVASSDYSWLFTSLLTASLNALKFFLAYKLGLHLGGKLLGILMVLCLLLISFSTMQTITFTHTNLVETVMLLVLFLVYRKDSSIDPSKRLWVVLGFICGLAFHVHPTALLVGYFVFIKWLKSSNKILHSLLFIMGFVVVFIPLIIYGLNSEGGILSGVVSYADRNFSGFNVIEFLRLFVGLVFMAPYTQLLALFNQQTAMFLALIQTALVILALVSPLLTWRNINQHHRNIFSHMWLFFLLSCIGLILIREQTRWYMTYGVCLTISILVAMGIFHLQKNFKINKIIFFQGLWIFVVFIMVQAKLISHLNTNELVVTSNALKDVKSFDVELSGFSYEITAHQAKNHGQFTCKNRPVALHGPYSQLIFSHSGIEHLSNCGDGLAYGPVEKAFNVLGVPPEYAELIAFEPVETIGGTSFYYPIDTSKKQKAFVETFTHDYERAFKRKDNWNNETITDSLQGGNNLVITNLAGFKMRQAILSVQLNGNEIKPIKTRSHSALYNCIDCIPTKNTWTIQYKESIDGMTNIVSF